MPHKCLITHRVKPGHYKEVKKWFSDEDKKRKEKNPQYKPPRRYVTVYGQTSEVVCEFDIDSDSESQLHGSWLEGSFGHEHHMDSVEVTILKEIDDYDE